VCGEDVPASLRDVPCLSDDEVRDLARLGHRVSEHYGCPQDIEWAVTGGGLVLLQSRPETVWSQRRGGPLAEPKARPFDHVLERLSSPGREAGP
jgi:pyruvate,water dikinase